MNGEYALGTVSALFTPQPSGAAAHSSWLLLYANRPRHLLLPKHDLAVQRRCVRMFRSGLGALAGELALVLHRLVPGASLPEGFDGPAVAQAQWLARLPLQGLSAAAVQLGTPGPYQKATLLLLDEHGRPLALAKAAVGARADCMVEREGRCLARLSAMPAVAGQVPRLLARGRTDGGRAFIVTDVGPNRQGAGRFDAAARGFLTALGRASVRATRFDDAPARRRVQVRLARLYRRTPPYAAASLRSAAADCDQALCGWTAPLVTAHGDFAPWNTRRGACGRYVFDWEYAQEGASPAADALHWLLLPRALARRGLSVRAMRAAQATVGAHLAATYAEYAWSPRVVSALVLHYLLDTMLFYGMADGAINFNHPVNRHYWRMVEGRGQWMA